jgi:hypothetical protein
MKEICLPIRFQTATAFNDAIQDWFAFVPVKPDILGKTTKIVNARVRAFTGNGQRLPSVGPFRIREVIERRKRPAPLLVHQEREVLQMVVPVVRDDV